MRGPIIRALRAAGHDVVSIAESAKGSPDENVIAEALRADRVLVTEDRDFGELVFARMHTSAGVVLVRFLRRAQAVETQGGR